MALKERHFHEFFLVMMSNEKFYLNHYVSIIFCRPLKKRTKAHVKCSIMILTIVCYSILHL